MKSEEKYPNNFQKFLTQFSDEKILLAIPYRYSMDGWLFLFWQYFYYCHWHNRNFHLYLSVQRKFFLKF